MDKQGVIIIVVIFLVLLSTSFFLWQRLEGELYHSPEELFPPIETIPINQEYCYDTDFGLDYFINGAVLWGVGDGELHTSQDYCTLDPSWEKETLFEMYCVGNKFKIKDMKCPEGCEEGICV